MHSLFLRDRNIKYIHLLAPISNNDWREYENIMQPSLVVIAGGAERDRFHMRRRIQHDMATWESG